MIFYAIPSLVAVLLKFCILAFSWKAIKLVSVYLKIFLFSLFFLNLSELAAFFFVSDPQSGFSVLLSYYFFALLSFYSLLALTLDNANKLTLPIKIILLISFLIVTVVLLIPNAALAGVESIGYSITRVAGPYYFVIQLGLLLPLLCSLVLLFYFSARGESVVIQQKAKILLFACSPVFASTLLVIVLMQLGYRINASVVLSLMITVTMFVLLLSERKEYRFQFMDRAYLYRMARLIPRSTDSRFIAAMVNLVTHPNIGLEKGRELIEQEMVREALVLSNGHKGKAAEMLGISRQTLIRKINND